MIGKRKKLYFAAVLVCVVGTCLVVPSFAFAEDEATASSGQAASSSETDADTTDDGTGTPSTSDPASPAEPSVDPGTTGNENNESGGGSFTPQESEDEDDSGSGTETPSEPSEPSGSGTSSNTTPAETPTTPTTPSTPVVPSTPDPTVNRAENSGTTTRTARTYTDYSSTTYVAAPVNSTKSKGKVFSTWAGGVDTTWYVGHENKRTYKIDSADQLAGLAELVNSGYAFEGKTIVLTANIDLAKLEWKPIGQTSYFMGSFDGKGHIIKNLSIKSDINYAGLFGASYNASFKNIKLVDVDIDALQYVGGIVGLAYGDTAIDTCSVRGNISGDYFVGGLVGLAYTSVDASTVSNSTFRGAIGAGTYSDKLIGYTQTI